MLVTGFKFFPSLLILSYLYKYRSRGCDLWIFSISWLCHEDRIIIHTIHSPQDNFLAFPKSLNLSTIRGRVFITLIPQVSTGYPQCFHTRCGVMCLQVVGVIDQMHFRRAIHIPQMLSTAP